ncbi:hypothetical protein CALVIDRAFT_531864 [Calocera viscosa TUFC12733]|uniref:Uncharacterized protein n=1 Tax=Calocera viscosa (strain TUFC12733) TaxID=1330018 RepID=A0A167FSI2_CALVF|nr:hypothetical protein CALVIDRAFT_531864 [Calocera viscosa TUFC12733]
MHSADPPWQAYTASFAHAIKVFGRIDGVFLNASVYDSPGGYWENMEQSIVLTLDVNVSAVMKGARVAIDHLLVQQTPGLIVVTGSITAQTTSVKVYARHAALGDPFTHSRSPSRIYVARNWAIEVLLVPILDSYQALNRVQNRVLSGPSQH